MKLRAHLESVDGCMYGRPSAPVYDLGGCIHAGDPLQQIHHLPDGASLSMGFRVWCHHCWPSGLLVFGRWAMLHALSMRRRAEAVLRFFSASLGDATVPNRLVLDVDMCHLTMSCTARRGTMGPCGQLELGSRSLQCPAQ